MPKQSDDMQNADAPPAPGGNLADAAGNVARTIETHRNLATLRMLAGPLRGAGNDQLIADLLGSVGIRTSSREVIATFDTLERLGALTIATRAGLTVVALRRRGAELADGTERDDEVAFAVGDCPY